MERKTIKSGGALTQRTTVVTANASAADVLELAQRINATPSRGDQILEIFEDFKRRLEAHGVTIRGPHGGVTVPRSFQHPEDAWYLERIYYDLRGALTQIVPDENRHAKRQLASPAILNAVGCGYSAGWLACELHLKKHEPATETGAKVRGGNAARRDRHNQRKTERSDYNKRLAREEAGRIWRDDASLQLKTVGWDIVRRQRDIGLCPRRARDEKTGEWIWKEVGFDTIQKAIADLKPKKRGNTS